jgi:similar to stage IV sporulation protein
MAEGGAAVSAGPLWWSGSLSLELRGNDVTGALHELQRQGISLYGIRFQGRICTLTISLSDFRRFYRVCRTHRVRFRVLARRGLPFTGRNLRRRKSMIAGFLLFVCLLFGLSSMVWSVSVTGVDDPDAEAAVLQAARDAGLVPGAWKRTLPDPGTLQRALQERLPNVAWVGVSVEGTRVTIEALQKIPGVTEESPPASNVVARKPAVIRRVLATRGQVLVHPGQTVHPGQILISGSLADGTRTVAAQGQVFAEVWYTSQVEVPLHVPQQALTGRFVAEDFLSVGGLNLRVWGWREPPFAAAFESDSVTDWHLGSWRLPVQWRHVKLYETSTAAVDQSADEALQEALRIAVQDVGRQMGDGRVLGQKVLQRQVTRGKLYATVLTWTEEDIGVSRRIAVDNSHNSH